ncbi:GtrA family protein [Aquibacillus halophilus]|uniref:GtrA family protein n=1 Tax=Aquibacillus halophilus TaxID=930132 RepID=A0A6A8DGA2_9BACI|nr:GtrA family protein [Aquibacillus halophilus]MRH44683.1 GtrA family protein [Aquibacillus halophilus]
MAKKIRGQLIQFGFIGISNAVVDIVTINVLLFIWPTKDSSLLLVFNTIAYILAILNSYVWNTKYTFSHHATIESKEIMLFILQAALALVINNIVFVGMFQLLENQTAFLSPTFVNQNIAKGMAMFLSSSASFFLMKYFVFRKTHKKEKKTLN